MKRINSQSLIAYCDNLTSKGDKLSITWNGGSDSGFFDMLLNDEPLPNETEFEEPIIDLIAYHLGYGSFTGDFSTKGELIYDCDNKCFEGEDSYYTSDSDKILCPIEIRVPKEIWFDRLEIHFEFDPNEDPPDENTTIRFVIENGPLSEAHRDLEDKIFKIISEKIKGATEHIEDITNVWVDVTIHYNDFTEKGIDLVFTFNEIEYGFYNYENKDISISLTDETE